MAELKKRKRLESKLATKLLSGGTKLLVEMLGFPKYFMGILIQFSLNISSLCPDPL